MNRGRVLLFRALAVVLGLILAVALLEIYHLGSSPAVQRRVGFALSAQACPSSHRRAVWHHDFGVRGVDMLSTLEPFCRDVEFDVRHNSQGFRGPSYTTAHPPDTFRVSVLGDSFTWGQGVVVDETFGAVLAGELGERYEGSWEVLNHGVQGSRIVDNYIRLLAHVEPLEPDLVIVQLIANDLYYSSWELVLPQLTLHDLRTGWLARLPVVSSIDKMRPAFDVARLYRRERLRSFAAGTLEWDLLVASLERFASWSVRTGTPIFFVVFPDVIDDPSNFEGYTRMPPEVAIIERAVAEIERHGMPLLDVTEVFRRRAGGATLAVSGGHPSVTAHRLAGEALFEELKRLRLLSCAGSSPKASDPRWRREHDLRQQAAASWDDHGRSYARQAAFYESLSGLYPENLWIVEQLAYARFRAGDHDPSHALYRSLADRAPELAAPWTYLAEMATSADPREDLEQMIRLVPDHPDALEQLISHHLREDERDRACELLSRLLRNARYPPQTRRALGFNRRLRCGDPRALLDPDGG